MNKVIRMIFRACPFIPRGVLSNTSTHSGSCRPQLTNVRPFGLAPAVAPCYHHSRASIRKGISFTLIPFLWSALGRIVIRSNKTGNSPLPNTQFNPYSKYTNRSESVLFKILHSPPLNGRIVAVIVV